MINSKRYLLRIVIPAFPSFNIYSRVARQTTALGPICVATSASKLERWDVEVVDENNCSSRFCPRDALGRPDHIRLQQERPADVAGFYGSLTSTIPRLYELAGLYKRLGAMTVAGGKHVENLPAEALTSDIDVVVFGDGEVTIRELLQAWQHGTALEEVAGIAFKLEGRVLRSDSRPNITDFELQPFPDFNLLRYARLKIYPIGSVRGCDMNCEFCAVKDKTRCASPERMVAQIAHLVETRQARKFFDVSDHFISDRQQAMKFCRQLSDYRKSKSVRFGITVQTRLSDARYPALLEAMRAAGIYNVCIGYESPLDEELKTMRKGYRAQDMLQWTRVYHRHGFFIHGMFIFGYPQRRGHRTNMPLREQARRFRTFIRRARIDTAQVLLAVPLPGTELRNRLDSEGRLYPIDQIGWEYYDGQFPLFEPDDGVPPEEVQRTARGIMSRFYHFRHFLRMVIHILVTFPLLVFPSVFTIVTFQVRHIRDAFLAWKRKFFRNSLVRFGGYLVIKNWLRKFRSSNFLDKLKSARHRVRRRRTRAGNTSVEAGP